MKRSTKIALLLIVGLLLAGVGYVAAAGGVPDLNSLRPQRTFTVEVAENGTRFSPDGDPLDSDGFPLYGGEFITQGYLYPEGTLTCDSDNNCNGTNPDGSPEFPDEVIGLWTCRGWHVSDSATTTTGPVVITTQTYSFGDSPTANNITTDGYELADYNIESERSIIGGTGHYRNARGQQVQEFLGWGESVGVVLKVTFDMNR